MGSNQNQQEWNQIIAWLQSLNYAHYASLFKSGGYDLWEIIFDLTANDLREIGIKPGHSKRIQKSLLLKKQQQQASTDSAKQSKLQIHASSNASSPKREVSNQS